jgi:uncharacterized protein YbbK (DUF523 family)
LADRFNIIAVCPEVEIGLDVPRDKIELHQQGKKIHLLTSISNLDSLAALSDVF